MFSLLESNLELPEHIIMAVPCTMLRRLEEDLSYAIGGILSRLLQYIYS